ncbi:glycosyltransferase family 4 protein [Herbidospora mongoliensis]|uniref:glycosyltransferase family 4 protein n=1 Tax=Herbidospora mongoliensis TaxID=688067 RepID=UPI00082AAF33|nr:glycosyltransferase family 4 protein [Herbidospora mongoliensis]
MVRVVMAHPSPDLYGSDRMLVESVRALSELAEITVALPAEGPLCTLIKKAGAEVEILPVPVLRKAYLKPVGLLRLAAELATTLPRMVSHLRKNRPAVLYVNTVTIPWWLLAGRLARVPRVVCHVHEAEESVPGPIRRALALPLRLAHSIIAISHSVRDRITADGAPDGKTTVIHNGVAGPPPTDPRPEHEGHLVLVGRLSPRKGNDVAVEAAKLLVSRGHTIKLTLAGTIFPGYEWYEAELRAKAGPEVIFAGFADPVWPLLATADVVLVPSRVEPFGLVAVEGMLSRRPVVASAVQGLAEIVHDEKTGLLVPPGDPVALADAVEILLNDWTAAKALANRGFDDAVSRFGLQRYTEAMKREILGPDADV